MDLSNEKRPVSRSLTSKTTYVDYDYLIKVVVVGDSGVGKSQLVGRFTRNEFTSHSRQTIGVEFATKTIAINLKNICVQLWDTAGEERYRALASAYYRGAVGVLLVFDVTNMRSFTNLTHWLSEVKSYTPETCQIILVGNKIDLNGVRKVSTEQAKAYADANGMTYIETSALQCTNVEASFEMLISHVYYRTIVNNSGQAGHSTTVTGQSGQVHVNNENHAEKITFNCCGTA